MPMPPLVLRVSKESRRACRAGQIADIAGQVSEWRIGSPRWMRQAGLIRARAERMPTEIVKELAVAANSLTPKLPEIRSPRDNSTNQQNQQLDLAGGYNAI